MPFLLFVAARQFSFCLHTPQEYRDEKNSRLNSNQSNQSKIPPPPPSPLSGVLMFQISLLVLLLFPWNLWPARKAQPKRGTQKKETVIVLVRTVLLPFRWVGTRRRCCVTEWEGKSSSSSRPTLWHEGTQFDGRRRLSLFLFLSSQRLEKVVKVTNKKTTKIYSRKLDRCTAAPFLLFDGWGGHLCREEAQGEECAKSSTTMTKPFDFRSLVFVSFQSIVQEKKKKGSRKVRCRRISERSRCAGCKSTGGDDDTTVNRRFDGSEVLLRLLFLAGLSDPVAHLLQWNK